MRSWQQQWDNQLHLIHQNSESVRHKPDSCQRTSACPCRGNVLWRLQGKIVRDDSLKSFYLEDLNTSFNRTKLHTLKHIHQAHYAGATELYLDLSMYPHRPSHQIHQDSLSSHHTAGPGRCTGTCPHTTLRGICRRRGAALEYGTLLT